MISLIHINSRLLGTFWPAIFWTLQTDSPNATNQKSAPQQVRCLEPVLMENPSMNWMRTGGTPMTWETSVYSIIHN
jgi:hypothetical protein